MVWLGHAIVKYGTEREDVGQPKEEGENKKRKEET